MKENTRGTNVMSWVIEKLIIYVLPVAFVLYVDFTQCFPYNFARWLWKGTRHQHSPHVQDGFLYGVGLAMSASLYYGIRFLWTSLRKK
jgi:hypothetical protein